MGKFFISFNGFLGFSPDQPNTCIKKKPIVFLVNQVNVALAMTIYKIWDFWKSLIEKTYSLLLARPEEKIMFHRTERIMQGLAWFMEKQHLFIK